MFQAELDAIDAQRQRLKPATVELYKALAAAGRRIKPTSRHPAGRATARPIMQDLSRVGMFSAFHRSCGRAGGVFAGWPVRGPPGCQAPTNENGL